MAWSLGIDLSQTSCGLVAVPHVFFDTLDWSLPRSVALGRELGSAATAWDRAMLLQDLVDGIIEWIYSHGWGVPDSVWVEQYPMGGGTLFNLDKVAELGGALRLTLLREFRLPMHAAPIQSARKLLLGSLTSVALDMAVTSGIECGLFTKAAAKSMGRQKAAVWAELHRMGAKLYGPDAGDAFVALNFGMYASGLQCLSALAPRQGP